MAFDTLRLFRPALVVHAKRFGPTMERNLVEARFHDLEERAALRIFEREGDERCGFGRVIDVCIQSVRMPAIGETPLRLNVHELNIHYVMLGARLGYVAADLLTGPIRPGAAPDAEQR